MNSMSKVGPGIVEAIALVLFTLSLCFIGLG